MSKLFKTSLDLFSFSDMKWQDLRQVWTFLDIMKCIDRILVSTKWIDSIDIAKGVKRVHPIVFVSNITIFQSSCLLCIHFWINLELRRVGEKSTISDAVLLKIVKVWQGLTNILITKETTSLKCTLSHCTGALKSK